MLISLEQVEISAWNFKHVIFIFKTAHWQLFSVLMTGKHIKRLNEFYVFANVKKCFIQYSQNNYVIAAPLQSMRDSTRKSMKYATSLRVITSKSTRNTIIGCILLSLLKFLWFKVACWLPVVDFDCTFLVVLFWLYFSGCFFLVVFFWLYFSGCISLVAVLLCWGCCYKIICWFIFWMKLLRCMTAAA